MSVPPTRPGGGWRPRPVNNTRRDDSEINLGQGAQPGPPDSPPTGHLAMFILDGTLNEKKALIPIPQSYQEAQKAVFALFQPYLPQSIQPSKISLRPSLTGNLEDCAEIEAKYWRLAFPLCKMVGVFPDVFLCGVLWVTVWQDLGWSCVKAKDDEGRREMLYIARPSTYKAAVNSLLGAIERLDVPLPAEFWEWTGPQMPSNQKVICYKFCGPSARRFETRAPGSTEEFDVMATDSWSQIPESAYTDEEAWRRLCPLPGEIIGFKFTDK
ncbi:hypothetical protein FA15DRAFT_664634 [Coprinopsis marcescibilis]|uniref:Uncharacterized protein n=1 Tax=Coprinopsis marcescibilis TaxID=230819 RepID=A0A5C3L8G2_COPMA|nr:hypothetical protein FA15DRAFT_664634 [Coprinopsis marcescibilis]